jgi:Rad3-related DNA helicase
LESDFNYKKQALVFLPDDLWHIKYNNFEVLIFLKEFISIVKWQTLVLFRALSLIKEFYIDLHRALKNENINIYAQWIWGSKHKLLSFYKKNYKNSIIMWSDTFWEWIDLQQEELKYLIIHKIPFDPPTDPIFKARSQLFRDPFKNYSIPKAIIRLKQWFWRLIRTKKDSWIIIFLDNRVFDTFWWNLVLEAFPKWINIKKGNSETLLKLLRIKNNKK